MRIQYQKGGNYFSAMGLSKEIENFLMACVDLRFAKFNDLSYDKKIVFEKFIASLPIGIFKKESEK